MDILKRLLGAAGHQQDELGSGSGRKEKSKAPKNPVISRALELVEQEEEIAKAEFEERLQALDRKGCIDALDRMLSWKAVERILEEKEKPSILLYLVDSIALEEGYDYLFEDPSVESVTYMTGIVSSDRNLCTLNRVVKFKLEWQSATGAKADPDSSFKALRELEKRGHQMLGWYHSHVNGVSAFPSERDKRYQRGFEGGGYSAIGIVADEEGIIRFFSEDLKFEVEVYGAGVEKVRDKVYQLER